MASEHEKAFLRQPETKQRWHDALVALNKELEAQFSERRAAAELKQQQCLKRGPEGKGEWFAFRAQHQSWRAGATRFKSKVEERLSECKRLMRQARSDRVPARAPGELALYRRTLAEVRGFLSDEAAAAPAYQGARRDLLRLVDHALSKPAGQQDRDRGAGQ